MKETMLCLPGPTEVVVTSSSEPPQKNSITLIELTKTLGSTVKHDDANKVITFLGMLFVFIGLIGALGSEVFPGAEYFSRRGVLPHPADAIHYPVDSDLKQVWILVLVGVIVFFIGFLSP